VSYIDPDAVSDLVEEAGIGSSGDPALDAYNWIEENIEYGYGGIFRKDRGRSIRDVREILEDREAICYEQAALWLSMVKAAGEENVYLARITSPVDKTFEHYTGALKDGDDLIIYDLSMEKVVEAQRKGDNYKLDTFEVELLNPDDAENRLKEFENTEKLTEYFNDRRVPLKYWHYREGDHDIRDYRNLYVDPFQVVIEGRRMDDVDGKRVGDESFQAYFHHGKLKEIDYTLIDKKRVLGLFWIDRVYNATLTVDEQGYNCSGDREVEDKVEMLYQEMRDFPAERVARAYRQYMGRRMIDEI